MEKEIKELIRLLKNGAYDVEILHDRYDRLLERFVLYYDESLLPIMEELIFLEKDFWYA